MGFKLLSALPRYVTAWHPLKITDSGWMMSVSVQALQVFRKATGAVYNTNDWAYTVDCNQMGNFSNVNIGMADGSTLVLIPQDFIYVSTYSKKCYLMVYGSYDDGDPTNSLYSIRLGQQWLNRHCVSYDINANTLAYTDAVPNNGN